MAEFRHLRDQLVHKGGVWNLVIGSFEDPHGAEFTRDVVRSPGSVAALPLLFDPEGVPSVVLIRQFRPTYGEYLYEVPAGMRDIPGEPIEQTAHRELIEEVGLIAGETRACVFPQALSRYDRCGHRVVYCDELRSRTI
jgi:8-oxo-dGTP pyrophosphatase MutT (NUDIX family)